MTDRVHDSHHLLILKPGTKNSNYLNFTMIPCKKCALNFKKSEISKKTKNLAIFKSLHLPFGSLCFSET